ncbi:hypothetical protein HWV62_29438 [Athelia sp. TMB]|nr:hypothetical protein HWV62_40535 [Athelia sp. TMB]KAF7980837.1 hypothetical protein HWV62_36474 [Athelia sp. TMB]KAF7982231.1 hypothetical protein HWV62_29438 [Athelia sp. TMB]
MHMDDFDVVVIGAGIYGIAFARFYLEVHPECRLIILDKEKSLGGVWCAARSFPTFRSQISTGLVGFADAPIKPPADLYHDFVDASCILEYLESYCDAHSYNGKTILERMVFSFTVDKVDKSSGQWYIHGRSAEQDGETVFRSMKLVVATGPYSTPNMPSFPGQADFNGPIIHQKDFGSSEVLPSPNIQHVTVLGAGKSAVDMVYASAKAGKTTSWVINKSGTGPPSLTVSKPNKHFKNASEPGSTRILGYLGLSYYTSDNWCTWFLYRTRLGRWLTSLVWKAATAGPRKIFDSGIEAGPTFQHLRPTLDIFWGAGNVGLIQFPDFWETVAKNVTIHRADVTLLSQKSVHLSDGTEIHADTLCCGTGWKPSNNTIFTIPQLVSLGLPHPLEDDPPQERALWSELMEQSLPEILHKFPILANPPYPAKEQRVTPYRLWNHMAPVEEAASTNHTIVILGHITVPNGFRPADVQAIWATAYLDNALPVPSLEDTRRKVAKRLVWNQRRYIKGGALGNGLLFDGMMYTDHLLNEVGLKSHLGKGWWARMFGCAYAEDLKGCKDEYLAKFHGRQNAR